MTLLPDRLPLVGPESRFVERIVAAADGLRTRHPGLLGREDVDLARSKEEVAAVVNAAFWAGLAVEEGRSVSGVLCLVPASATVGSLPLRTPATLDALVPLLTAAGGSGLGLQRSSSGKAEIWGFCEPSQKSWVKLRLVRPGVLVAIAAGDVIGILEAGTERIPKGATRHRILEIVAATLESTGLGLDERMRKAAHLLTIVSAVLRHGHGGTLVVVPAGLSLEDLVLVKFELQPKGWGGGLGQVLDEWLESASRVELLELDLQTGGPGSESRDLLQPQERLARTQEAARYALDRVGSLTAVDGAVVLDDTFSVVGFGAKLIARSENLREVATIDAIAGGEAQLVRLSDLGGTRHQSAVHLVACSIECTAFVASQDGRLTLVAGVKDQQSVLAVTGLHHLLAEVA